MSSGHEKGAKKSCRENKKEENTCMNKAYMLYNRLRNRSKPNAMYVAKFQMACAEM
jgi:hypothetical protein